MSKKGVPKHFLTNEEKEKIQTLFKAGRSVYSIAKEMNFKQRKVSDYIKSYIAGEDNTWSIFEEELLFKLYNEALSDFQIAKFLPKKSVSMVRNRIKYYERRGMLTRGRVYKEFNRFSLGENEEKQTTQTEIKGFDDNINVLDVAVDVPRETTQFELEKNPTDIVDDTTCDNLFDFDLFIID